MNNYFKRLDVDIYQCAACQKLYTGAGSRHLAQKCCAELKPLSTLALRQAAAIIYSRTDPAGTFTPEPEPYTPPPRAARRKSTDVNADPRLHGNYSRSRKNPAAIIDKILKQKDDVKMTRWRNKQTRAWAYKYLVLRDGEKCLLCGIDGKLEIDHADTDLHNDKPENLSLLCPVCNKKMRMLTIAGHLAEIAAARCSQSVCDRERTYNRTELIKHDLDYSTGSLECKIANYCEIVFREYVINEINKHETIDKAEAINAGAEAAGCSPTTTARYLIKMTSKTGALYEYRDPTGKIKITLKHRSAKK